MRDASRVREWLVPGPDGIPIGILPRIRSKSCANRVHQDVSGSSGQGLVTTQSAVMECGRPDAGSRIEAGPHMTRRIALQTSNQSRQGFPIAEVHQAMPVIRHQNPGQECGSPPETGIRDCPACACCRLAVVEQRGTPVCGEGDEVCAAGQRNAAAPECGMTGAHGGRVMRGAKGHYRGNADLRVGRGLRRSCGRWWCVGVGRGLRRSYRERWGVCVGAA